MRLDYRRLVKFTLLASRNLKGFMPQVFPWSDTILRNDGCRHWGNLSAAQKCEISELVRRFHLYISASAGRGNYGPPEGVDKQPV